jgi:hypothetical protein
MTNRYVYKVKREGEQPFDAYGYSQVSEAHKIADHVFTYSGNNDSFFIGTASGGYVEHNSSLSSNILNVSVYQDQVYIKHHIFHIHMYQETERLCLPLYRVVIRVRMV